MFDEDSTRNIRENMLSQLIAGDAPLEMLTNEAFKRMPLRNAYIDAGISFEWMNADWISAEPYAGRFLNLKLLIITRYWQTRRKI